MLQGHLVRSSYLAGNHALIVMSQIPTLMSEIFTDECTQQVTKTAVIEKADGCVNWCPYEYIY